MGAYRLSDNPRVVVIVVGLLLVLAVVVPVLVVQTSPEEPLIPGGMVGTYLSADNPDDYIVLLEDGGVSGQFDAGGNTSVIEFQGEWSVMGEDKLKLCINPVGSSEGACDYLDIVDGKIVNQVGKEWVKVATQEEE
jgi:hypothetical protein